MRDVCGFDLPSGTGISGWKPPVVREEKLTASQHITLVSTKTKAAANCSWLATLTLTALSA